MTFEEVTKAWFDNKRMYVKESTASAYYTQMKNRLLPTFGNREMDSLIGDDLQSYVFEMSKRLSLKSIQDVVIIFKMVYNFWVVEFGGIQKSMKIRMPKSEKRKILEVYTEAEQKKIISCAIESPSFEKIGFLLTITLGLRIGEVCALKWSDIDFSQQIIHINSTLERIYDSDTGKSKIIFSSPKTPSSFRTVPIPKQLVGLLKIFGKTCKDEYFVTTGKKRFCEPRTYRNYYRNFILKEVGLCHCLKFHGLRHSFATRMVSKGTDVKTLSTILGHSDVSTTMNLYVHPSMEDRAEAINKAFKKMF